ncbi:hypothetical protein J0A68_20825 [Algoriphagus sp. H41]|uniref:FIST domain-containing protein n=1 Tax=Algoriphagus oliviformis TaxID=2811231 RepID=A0ABS3C8I1_9BACT|nr:hypothetical protein [Algoriphagus oliviformis]MBN7813412.1 hypothetical protein [Algoriphagus oliviformis]
MAQAFLLSHLPAMHGEFARISPLESMATPISTIGTLTKVSFRNIRRFLHPDSDRVSLRELRGRYLTASVYMDVATSFLVDRLEIPRANRVFWGLGGGMFLIPRHFRQKLHDGLLEFNKIHGIPEIGFELHIDHGDVEGQARETSESQTGLEQRKHSKDKLAGWKGFSGNSGEAESDYVVRFARGLANSDFWSFQYGGRNLANRKSGLESALESLPFWVYPASRYPDGESVPRGSYLADLGGDCPLMDTSLVDLASGQGNAMVTYFRLDVSGMSGVLRRAAMEGVGEVYGLCRRMELFFRETIPEICRDFNANPQQGLSVALLHATCDDAILVARGENPNPLAERLVGACRERTGQKLVYGGIQLRPGHTSSDLSHGAMLRLAANKQLQK